ncbi:MULTISPECIES: hypothetical protein [unclassified Brucella]|uniref:hypothetical protein n=1 Tax=unclassified Brucella TaxID=2632610 RepID=UPI0012AD7BA0|nr:MULTISPECIES: hypothetical protein [unclassified Brucella]MRN76924.1 hypothetical protein [Brucella sp. 10RB9210]UWF59859.1 hypothetical protein NYO66_04940 [Brucella sp. 2716]
MRLLVLLINCAQLVTIAYLFTTQGAPNGDELLFVSLLIVCPAITLLYLFSLNRTSAAGASVRELVSLEMQARKAKLRREIDGK